MLGFAGRAGRRSQIPAWPIASSSLHTKACLRQQSSNRTCLPRPPPTGWGKLTQTAASRYRAIFRWDHYEGRRCSSLPKDTTACASVTSAFLQVIHVLYQVERSRDRGSRNILQVGTCPCPGCTARGMAFAVAGPQSHTRRGEADISGLDLQTLSTNTRRTKVVELASGTHR